MKILVEDWQVKDETKNGIYIDIDYGLLNSGTILIPSHQVNKLDDGNYNIFIKKKITSTSQILVMLVKINL